MDGLSNLLSTLFPLLFVVGVVLTAFQFWRRYQKVQDTGPSFPDLDSAPVIFRETRATGRSLLNWKTRLGGGRNVLEVVVTETEVWIRAPMPFAIVAQHYDGLHRVPLTDVKMQSVASGEFTRKKFSALTGIGHDAQHLDA